MLLAQLSASFQSCPLLSTSKLGPLVLIPRWVDLCMFYGPVSLSNELSCEAGSFYCCCLNPHPLWYFPSEVLRFYFPALEPWVVWSVWLPSCSSQFICTRLWDCPATSYFFTHPVLNSLACRASSPPHLPSPPLVPV